MVDEEGALYLNYVKEWLGGTLYLNYVKGWQVAAYLVITCKTVEREGILGEKYMKEHGQDEERDSHKRENKK